MTPALRHLAFAAAVAAAAVPLAGCAPMIVAGAAGAALVATDRRSAGAQLDDTTVETRLATSFATRPLAPVSPRSDRQVRKARVTSAR